MLQPLTSRACVRRRAFSVSAALPLAAAALALVALPAPVRADPTALDNASNGVYDDGWQSGDNGGFGFLPWVLSTNGSGSAGRFIGNSNNNGGSPGINVANEAFGMFANSGGQSFARRDFSPLAVNDTFNISIDNGDVDTNSSIGFDLVNSGGASLFTFMFVGGQSNYRYVDSATPSGGTATSLPFTRNGINTSFKLNSPTSYTFTATSLGTGSTSFTIPSGAIAAGQTISGVRLFNLNAGFNSSNDFFANNLEIVPEPGTLALALPALAAVGVGAGLRRRRARRTT